MADKRLKGQEVEVLILRAGSVDEAFTAVSSFNDTLKLEKKEDGFLGEVTNRYDEIFNGMDFGMEIQVENSKWMLFQAAIKDRAQRRTPDLVINVIRTDFYANGDTPSRTYLDCFFGPQPTTVSARGDFVRVSLDGSCSDTDDNLDGLL